jgi:hypothetical protein
MIGFSARVVWLVVGALLAIACPAFADDAEKLFGTWKVLSAVVEDVQTKEKVPLYGEHPTGYLILLPSGRMMALLVSEGRKEPQTDEERATAYRSMVAYTGKYTIEGNKWTTRPDVAWNEQYMMDQVRYFSVDGNRLIVETAPAMSPDFGKVVRFVVVWQKEG